MRAAFVLAGTEPPSGGMGVFIKYPCPSPCPLDEFSSETAIESFGDTGVDSPGTLPSVPRDIARLSLGTGSGCPTGQPADIHASNSGYGTLVSWRSLCFLMRAHSVF